MSHIAIIMSQSRVCCISNTCIPLKACSIYAFAAKLLSDYRINKFYELNDRSFANSMRLKKYVWSDCQQVHPKNITDAKQGWEKLMGSIGVSYRSGVSHHASDTCELLRIIEFDQHRRESIFVVDQQFIYVGQSRAARMIHDAWWYDARRSLEPAEKRLNGRAW